MRAALARSSHDARERLLAQMLDLLSAFVAPACAIAYILDGNGVEDPTVLRCAPGHDPARAENLVRLLRQLEPIDPFSPRRAEASRVTVLSATDVGGEDRYARSPHGVHLRRHGYGTPVALYLRSAGALAAAIVLVREAGAPPFDAHAVHLVGELHDLLAQALDLTAAPLVPAFRELPRTATLTTRETEVAALVAGGARNHDIARTLGVSESTVKAHLTSVYTKLQIRSRTQLAVLVGTLG
jgi:DNA-binding CsgD family transcriptional regulator